MKNPLQNKKAFSFLLFFVVIVSFIIYFVQESKVNRKNSIKFVKFSKQTSNVVLDKKEQDMLLKFKNESLKCILNEEDKNDILKIKEYLQNEVLKIKPDAKKQEVYIKFCKIAKITKRKNIKKFIYSFRKCRSENLKKAFPDKKDLKKIISKLPLKETIEIYEGIN